MLLRSHTLGPFATNCYIIADGLACWIVDASFEPAPLLADFRELALTPQALILTHAHVDHIAGIPDIRRAYPKLPIWIHNAERDWLGDPMLNLSALMGMSVSVPGPDRLLEHGEKLALGSLTWEVRHTPGHSPGGIGLYCPQEHTLIAGDTLFAGSIGRTDFPGSDFATLERSIREQLYTLGDDTKVYPGHGPATTVGREKRSNPYVRP